METMTKRGCCSEIFSFLKQVNAPTAVGCGESGELRLAVPFQINAMVRRRCRRLHKDFFHDELDRSTRNLGSCSYVEGPVLPLMSSTPQGRLSELLALKWDERGELHTIDKINLLQVLKKVLTDEFFSSSLSTAPPPSESRDV